MAIDRGGSTAKRKPKSNNHKRNTREYVPPKKQTKKSKKKTEKKKEEPKKSAMPKTRSGAISSHYGQVASKTQVNKQNIKDANIKNAVGSVKKSLTESKTTAKKAGTSWGNVSNTSQDRTFTDKKWTPTSVAKDVKKAVNPHKGDTVQSVWDMKKKKGETDQEFLARKVKAASKYNANGVIRQEQKTDTGYTDKDREKIAKSAEKDLNDFYGKKYNRVKAFRDQWSEKGGLGDQFKDIYGREATAEEKKEYYKKYWKPEYKTQTEKLAKEQSKEIAKEQAPEKLYSKELSANESAALRYYSTKVGKAKDGESYANKALESLGTLKYSLDDLGTKKPDGTKVTKKDLGKVKLDKKGKPIFQKVEARDYQGNVVKDKKGNPVKVDRNVAEEVGSLTAAGANNAKFAVGFMQGSGVNNVLHSGVGEYNNAAKKVLTNATESGAFNAGYMGGIMAQFMGTGTAKVAEGLMEQSAKAATKGAGTKFAQNRLVELGLETPLNFADAVKMATDPDGKVDTKTLAMYMGLNSAMTVGMGGAIEGAGLGLTRANSKEFIQLQAKALKLKERGLKLSPEDMKRLNTLQGKLDEAGKNLALAKSSVANKTNYNAKVAKDVFSETQSADKAIKSMQGAGTHVEKMDYAKAIKDRAMTEFDELRTKRADTLAKIETASPEKAVELREEATALQKQMDHLANVANGADRQLQIETKKNKRALQDLTENVNKLSEKTGVKYRVVNDKDMRKLIAESGEDVSDEYFYKGFYYKNKDGETEILINSESPQAHQTVIGHETGHLIKTANEEEFKKLGSMLEEYAKKQKEYDEIAEQLKRSYPEATPDELQEEITCELLGRYVYGKDDKFIKQLAGENPSVVRKIVDYLKQLFDNSTSKEMRAELKAIIDKTEELVKNVDSTKARGYNNATEVVENGRGFGNEKTGGSVAPEGRSQRVVAENNTSNAVGTKRGETARMDSGKSTKATKANNTKGVRDKLWETSKIVGGDKKVTKEANDAYMEAVRSGDLETAQKYIDSLAEIKFPKSVVRGADGKLEIQTHGTPEQFDAFDSLSEMGNHFGTRTAAEERMRGEQNPRYIEAYLNITNPIVIKEDLGSWDAGFGLTDKLHEMGVLSDKEYATLKENNTNENLQKLLKEKDYDGIQYINGDEDKGSTSYIVFDADRIKSSDPVTYYDNGDPIPLTERFSPKGEHNDEYRFSKQEKPPQGGSFNAHRDELLADAEESYGAKYTEDFNETGFIFPDGKLPKMGDYGQRAEDHNVVVSLYDDIGYDTHQAPKTAAMGRFLEEGNIRIMPENGSIEMSAVTKPTQEQFSAIRRFLNEHEEARIEFSGADGRSVDSKAYSNGVNADQVINDIKRFYSDGEIGGSDLNNFRFSKIPRVVATDGKTYDNVVKLDTNEFDGVSNSQRADHFRDFVYDNLAGEKFTAYDANGKPHTIEFAKADDTHKKIGSKRPIDTLDEIAEKPSYRTRNKQTQDAIVQADEIIEVSKYDHDAMDNQHGWLDKNGWEYRTLTIVDRNNNILDCKLNVARADDGRFILYEVKINKKIGQVDISATSGLPVNSNLSKGTIPQSAPKSNAIDTNVAQAFAKAQEAKAQKGKVSKELRETPKTNPKTKEAPQVKDEVIEKTETQKLSENKYASSEVKTALKDIEAAGVYKEEAEKAAKKFNELDKKIGAETKHIENARKSDKYATEAERDARIAELEDNINSLKRQQERVAGQIEQMGKMKAVDPDKTAEQQIREARGTRKANKELKGTDNLVNEDNWIKDKWNSVRRLWEDSLIEVENVAKRSGTDKTLREEIMTAANRVRNSMSVANQWVTGGRKSFDNKVGGKALDDIFTKELIDNETKYADFQEYLVMKHVPARHAKGTDIYPDISPELATKRVGELEEKYGDEIKTFAKDVYDYLDDLQQYRVDSGMLSKEAAEQFKKEYPFYIPTNRVNDESVDFFTGGMSNGIKSAKGGDSDVLDIYSQIYTATNKTIHAAEENQMLNLYFRAKGVTKAQLKDAELTDLEHAVIEAKVNKKTGTANVSFFVDGKPVKLPCSHQLALGLRELDGLEFERLMKAAKVATLYGKPFKALVTDWNLVFGVRNGMRDLQQAVVNSKDTRYFGSSMGAAAHAIANDDSPFRRLYASMGGEQAQLVSYDAVAKNMGIEKQGKVDTIHEKVQDWVDADINGKHINPIHYIEGINGAIEMMPRMCEFIGTIRKQANSILKKQGSSLKQLRKEVIDEVDALEKTGKIGQTEKSAEIENRLAQRIIGMVDKDTIDSAMRNANDITLNFGRSGVLGKALNMGFVPYLNPSIQGLSKLIRLFTEAGGEGGAKALMSIGMKLGTFTIAPAVINELALKDNEDYQNLNTRDKDNNFFIPIGDGKFIKLPKPRENAVLAEPVEYSLRYFIDKAEYDFFDMGKLKSEGNIWSKIPLTDEGKQSIRTAVDNIGVINPATSNMFSPLFQTMQNKTWYGGSIESAYEIENKKSQDRYDVGTSWVAIQLGQTGAAKFCNLSPKKIDNLLDSYTGMIYDLGISQTTEEAKTRGNYLVRTMASQFMKDSVFSNKLSTKAWAKTDGMTEEQADKYKSTYMYDTFKYDDAMDLITSDKNMTNAEKMAAKRELQKQKNKLNREAIDGADNTSNPLVDIAKHLGANRTLTYFLSDKGDKSKGTWADYYKTYKDAKGYGGLTKAQKEREAQKFLDVYTLGVKGQKKQDPTQFHDSPSWGMTGVAAAQLTKQGKLKKKDADTIMTSCGVYEKQTDVYHKYAEYGGNVSRYAITQKNVDKTMDKVEDWGMDTKSGLWKGAFDKSMGAKGGTIAMSLATAKKIGFKDRAYYIANSSDPMVMEKMNAARGFSKKYGHKTKEISTLAKQADALGDNNTYLKNDEIINACNNLKGNNEEKSMAYILLGGKPGKNPFGAIGDYSLDGDTGITADTDDGSGGRGRGGRRGHGGHGGGSGGSKGTMPKTASGAIKGKVTNPFSTSNGTKKSNLNDAYRKKAKKLRDQSRK